jgi:ribosomal protein S18 acetylase RimI-like enzyme
VTRVRPATAQDVPALRAVGVRTWEATYAGVLSDAAVARGVEEFFNDWSVGAAVRAGRMLVAVDDGGAVVGLLESDVVDAVRTMVWKLYVAPEAQRRGVGGRLLERALATATTPEVRVEHDARNAAAGAFFARHGFAADAVEEAADGARTVRRVRRVSPRGAPR